MQFSGPSKPFLAVNPPEIIHEQAPAPQQVQAPMPAPPTPPGYAPQVPPYGYPYPPPSPSGNAETLALVRAVIESSNAEKSTLMRALLERPAKETGSLEMLREILPMMQGGAGGTRALLQGVELARGLFGANPAPPAGQIEDLAMLGQVLRMIAPAPTPPAATPATAPNPPPMLTPPPGAPPPGCAWAYTASGWMIIQLEQLQQAPTPAPAPVAPPIAAKPNESASSLEEVLADPEIGKLFAGLSAFKGLA